MYFLSGVMGGSGTGTTTEAGIKMESQDYRSLIRKAILAADPQAHIIDPLELGEIRAAQLYPQGTPASKQWTDDSDVRDLFSDVLTAATTCDIIVCYLPCASMGSAIELHEARKAGRQILCICSEEMTSNWVVRCYSDVVFTSIDAFATYLLSPSFSSPTKPTLATTIPSSVTKT